MSDSLSRSAVPWLIPVLVWVTTGGCKPKGQEENGRLVAPRLQSISLHRIVIEQGCRGGQCRSRIELSVEGNRWLVGRDFPADRDKVAGLIRTWRRLVSDKVLVGTDSKRRDELGLSRPCLKVSWWSESGRELQVRVACTKGRLVLWDGKGPLHLVSRSIQELGARKRSWFFSHQVLSTRISDLSGLRIHRGDGKAVTLVRRDGWKLALSKWTMPADSIAVGAFVETLGSLQWKDVKRKGGRAGDKRIEIFSEGRPVGKRRGTLDRPAEVLTIGTCAGGGIRITRTRPYPATGCVGGAGMVLPSSLDLLDKSLLVVPPSDVTSLKWTGAGAFSLERMRGGWKIRHSGRLRDGDAEAVSDYLKLLRDTKAVRVVANRKGPAPDCLVFDSGTKRHRICIVERKGKVLWIRRDDDPLVFEFPAKVSGLLHPLPMRFFSRVAVTLPLGLVAGLTVTRSAGRKTYREVLVQHDNGDWFLREPMDAQADRVARADLVRRLSRLLVRHYRLVHSFPGGVTIELMGPDPSLRPLDGLRAFFKQVLQTALPGLADFHLGVARIERRCMGQLWGMAFDLDEETCRALTRSLVPRRILPGLRPDFVMGMKLCNGTSCRTFLVDKGRCLAKDGASVSQEACRMRVADAVGLTADRILGFEPAPRSLSGKICLRLATAAGSGMVAPNSRLARSCLMFGPERDGLRAVWVTGRPVVYGVNPALANRLVRSIPKE